MQGRKSALMIVPTESGLKDLLAIQRRSNALAGLSRRARMVTLFAGGESITGVSRAVGLGDRHVRKWLLRYQTEGLSGLSDRPRPGRKPVFSPRGRAARRQDRLRAA